jgi:putative ABC transport system permease protein
LKRNLVYFIRYYRLVAIAVSVMMAVITGSLVVGDSVRSTLVKRVGERLGDTETIIFSQNSFIETSILGTTLFNSADGVLLSNGFISVSGQLIPVMVWGTDKSIPKGGAGLNPALADELPESGDIVLRLPATGMTPSGSLFVTKNYTTSLRLERTSIIKVEDGGNLSLKNEQTIPFNIFVNRTELAEALKIGDKINLILHNGHISKEEFDKTWNYTMSGINADIREYQENERFIEISSGRVFIQEKAVETVCRNNPAPNRLFSYLVNSIELGNRSVPYSFATAIDSYKGQTLGDNEIILSDYAANRIEAKQNDTVRLSYYISHDFKTLQTKSRDFVVSRIVPLAELFADSTLSADFPGLSDVERCTDWDSDLPINMDLITAEDENYWKLYKTTPKVIISYNSVTDDWSNSYGSATAIRIKATEANLSGLSPDMFGIQIIYPKETGLIAAKSGVDFSSLFLALGFFIIISAILLMIVPLSEMLYRRRDEIELLKSLGYGRKRIAGLLWRESAPIVLLSSGAGVLFGLLYTYLTLFLLGNVWKGATQTSGFSIYPDFLTVFAGLIIGIAISMFVLWSALRKAVAKQLSAGRMKPAKATFRMIGRQWWIAFVFTFMTVVIMIVNLIFLESAALFVVAGVILIGTAAFWGDYLLYRNGFVKNTFKTEKLIWATLYANRKQAMLSFFTLAAGVFIVFSVGLNRKGFADSSQILSGTGGYTLWCENSVPVYHNINTQTGKEKLALSDLPSDVQAMQILRYGADNASCLNLNKVSKPTVLGVDMELLGKSDFEIEQSLYSGNKNEVFNMMQTIEGNESAGFVYPALVDETVLMWSLLLKLGDTISYEGSDGKKVIVRLAGTLKNSIFQGNILIDKKLFSQIWGEITGSEVMLLKVAETEAIATKKLISQALGDYGVRVSTTAGRLQEFNSVTDTYLTIFMTLGGLGLLLGIMSFIIVVRKSLSARRQEIFLYRTLGYNDGKIGKMLYKENIIVPIYAIATGVAASLTGVSISFMNTSIWLWLMALLFTAFFIACVLLFVKKSVNNSLIE